MPYLQRFRFEIIGSPHLNRHRDIPGARENLLALEGKRERINEEMIQEGRIRIQIAFRRAGKFRHLEGWLVDGRRGKRFNGIQTSR